MTSEGPDVGALNAGCSAAGGRVALVLLTPRGCSCGCQFSRWGPNGRCPLSGGAHDAPSRSTHRPEAVAAAGTVMPISFVASGMLGTSRSG
jgi:hypothetical protein